MTNPLRLLQLVKLLDVTRLTDDDSPEAFGDWLKSLPELAAPVACYCVYPDYIPLLKTWLEQQKHFAGIATVVNFPAGELSAEQVTTQIIQAVQAGADEIDCVLPYQALLRGKQQQVREFLRVIRQATADKCLKVIIESGELITAQQISIATELAIEEGADFIKSSTGKVPVGITREAARIMLTVIANAGRPVGFKASGGVRSVEQALLLVDLYEELTGKSATKDSMRIGASALLHDLAGQLA
ncbi:deoxyribose-phosphate aldolase [Chromatiaceae bacterium AAb-1]|nr:deoxyribose-phosphate aldolase [Chromatiaceae bacterium AAb-1]